MAITTIEAKKNQTIIDISIEYLGGVSGVVLLAKLNNISITDYLNKGRSILIDNTLIVNQKLVDYLDENQITPTS